MKTTDELAVNLGELKARHREEHICLRCDHHLVCGMAKALDPNLLTTISRCTAFEPIGETDEGTEDHDGQLSLG
jgi:hypothetical protein